jgi:hypothetical protein
MTDRSEFVGVRLTPDEREKFQSYVDESDEFSSLSRFFRVVAHRELATEDDQPTLDPQEVVQAVGDALTPLETQLDQIEDHVLSIDSSVRDDNKLDKLARDIYAALPIHESEDEFPGLDKESLEKYANTSDLALVQATSTPFMWAQYFDEDYTDIRRACSRMLEYYPDVNYVEGKIGGASSEYVDQHSDISKAQPTGETGGVYERRYYKTEETEAP